MRDSCIGEERADRGKLAGLFLFFRARSLSKSIAAKARALFGGRPNVSFDDIRLLLLPSLRHRLILNLEADAEGVDAEKILREIVAQVPEVA